MSAINDAARRLSADAASLRTAQQDHGELDVAASAPMHPIACMQGAFEESMMETTKELEAQSPKVYSEKVDSATRRRILLEQEQHEETHAARWRPRSGEIYHPLWKLLAQISFGVHLLHQQLAKSDEDVISILQTHVEEVDGFLEKTVEDFDLALDDTDERIQCLKLPLENLEVFDAMLENREFRASIVQGNERIEHIVSRTTTALVDALRDVKHGLEATKQLARYLAVLDREWPARSDEQQGIYTAMAGNAEGWFRCFVSLQKKGNSLQALLYQLSTVVGQTQKRAGVVSRKNIGTSLRSASSSGDVSTIHRTSRAPSPSLSLASSVANDPNVRAASLKASSKTPASDGGSLRERRASRDKGTSGGRVNGKRFHSGSERRAGESGSRRSSNEGRRSPSVRVPSSHHEGRSASTVTSTAAPPIPSRSASRKSLQAAQPLSPSSSSMQPRESSGSPMFQRLSSVWKDKQSQDDSPGSPPDEARAARSPTSGVDSPAVSPRNTLHQQPTDTDTDTDAAHLAARLSPLVGGVTGEQRTRSSSSHQRARPALTTIPSDSAYGSGASESQSHEPSPLMLTSKPHAKTEPETEPETAVASVPVPVSAPAGSEHVKTTALQPIAPQAQRFLGVSTPTPEKRRRRTRVRQALLRSWARLRVRVTVLRKTGKTGKQRTSPSPRPAEVVTVVDSAGPTSAVTPWV